MDKNENIVLKEGETKFVDEEGQEIITIELTSNILVILRNNISIIRSWRKLIDVIIDWSK